MRKLVLSLAAFLVLAPLAGAESPTRSEHWTAAATIAAIRSGERRTRSTCGSPGRTTRTG